MAKVKVHRKSPSVVSFTIKKVPDIKQQYNGFRKLVSGVVLATMLFAVGSFNFVSAANTPPSISINTINGQNPPFNFVCPSNPLFNPVTISGSGFGSSPPGHTSQYQVQVDWGDGTVHDSTGTFSVGDGPFTFTFNDTHSYATTSNFTIKARLYHSTPPGNDNQADSVVSVTICVHVPPPTKGTIILNKTVSGGTATSTDFSFNFANTAIPLSIPTDVATGTASVIESGPAGYTPSYTGDCNAQGSITVVAGQHYTCNILNTFAPPTTGTLTVVKNVSNNNGGSAVPGSFNIHVKSGGSDVTGSPQAGSASGTVYTLAGGAYTVSEDAVSGYTGSFSQSCSSGNVTVVNGQNVTCTITNDDQAASLTVIKHVENDNGGTKAASDFTINVTGANVSDTSFPGDEAGTTVSLDAGSYSVGEVNPGGYSVSYSASCSGTITNGEQVTCTVTNSDIQPKLTVIKVVENGDNETPLAVSDFPLFVDGNSVISGVQNGFNAGTVVVSETNQTNYNASFSADCDENGNVALGLGDVKTCTITNTYQAPPPPEPGTLIVIKTVENDNGGTLGSSDFTINVSGTNVSDTSFPGAGDPGTTVTMDAGSYSVDENSVAGYSASFSADCEGTLGEGETKTCTITNSDIQPKVTVTKVVVNDDGTASSTVSDFILKVGDTEVVSGEENGFNAGSYTISESGPGGYAATFSGNCNAAGEITLALGETKACTITNDDNEPNMFTLDVTITGDGDGTVTGDGINCDSKTEEDDCTETYVDGTVVTLTATADEGSNFNNSWTVGAGTCTGNTTPCQVTMNSNQSVTAHFSLGGINADMGITKTLSSGSPGQGATVTYTLTATNNGPDTASNVEVTDVLNSMLGYVSSSAS